MPIAVGHRIPASRLAEISSGEISEIGTEDLFSGHRAVMIGVPGAYTPVCTDKHLPGFVAGADKLRKSGFDLIVCLAANDPWTVRSWAAQVDPERKIRFLSDGNLEFSRSMGLTDIRRDLYLGERTSRFLMILENAIVQRLAVEPLAERLTKTRFSDVLV